MQLIFTKGPGKTDRLDVVRADGAVETIECPKQRIIPHDMVHYAVEQVMVRRGFLRRVQAGEPAAFTMRPEAESDAVERLVEVFQGDAWSGSGSPAAEMIELYRVTCDARSCPMLPVTETDIVEVKSGMAALTEQWEAVAVGQTLRLTF